MGEKVFVKFSKCILRSGTEVHSQQVESGVTKVKTYALGSLLKGRTDRLSIVKESAKSSVLFTYVYFFRIEKT